MQGGKSRYPFFSAQETRCDLSVSISIPLSLLRKLRKAAEVSGKSEAQIVREALVEKFAKDDENAD